ncbi:unnamed protein product [Amoebophrya sp. A25]|nr:unnamed protein product [Amoebophrya sp. A25]|eukprot:GSA25T00020526001.1
MAATQQGSSPHLKILFVGPEGVGKKHHSSYCPPTVGVRILEYDDSAAHQGKSYDDSVQLWDCSGAQTWENCFPALAKDVGGVVYVYNPELPEQTDALEYWYDRFGPRSLGLPPQSFMICQMLKSNQMRDYVVPTKISFASIQQPLTMTWENAAAKMKPAFDKYLGKVYKTVQERQRQEEEDVMKM